MKSFNAYIILYARSEKQSWVFSRNSLTSVRKAKLKRAETSAAARRILIQMRLGSQSVSGAGRQAGRQADVLFLGGAPDVFFGNLIALNSISEKTFASGQQNCEISRD
jgi:hypothetical protein